MDVWVFNAGDDEFGDGPRMVHDAQGTIDPEMWVSVWGVRHYPEAIYFFATLEAM